MIGGLTRRGRTVVASCTVRGDARVVVAGALERGCALMASLASSRC
jgi:hypothetical protein